MNGGTRGLLNLTRTLHIYLSLFGLLLILFFAVTGFIINHGEWFPLDNPKVTTQEGTLVARVADPVEELKLVEELRQKYGAAGAVDLPLDIEREEIRVIFRRPAQHTQALIRRADGHVEVTTEWRGVLAVFGDLHKGAYSGGAWRWVIDFAAALLTFTAISGLIMWMPLAKRRKIGLACLIAGTLASVALYWLFVP